MSVATVNPNISKLKLSKLTLFAYGCGDFASNMCWTFIGTYLSVFYTDALGLAPAVASIIMVVARIADGIFDPVFGAIAERTHSKYGRFRPYILYGAPILAVLTISCFIKYGNGGTFTAIMAFVTYLICGFAYTMVNLSYGSLSTVMTTDQEDVAQLNSYRMMGTNLSSVILNAITPVLLVALSGSHKITSTGYTKVAILFAILSLPIFYFTALNCKERIHPTSSQEKVKISETIKSVVKNKPLMLIFMIQLLAMTAFFGRMGVLAYYCLYNIRNMTYMTLFMALPSLATVIGIMLTKNYIIKVGKKKMAAVGYIGAAICLAAMFLIGQQSYENIIVLLVLNTLYGFFCFSFPIPMAMVTDAINYGEDKFGVRSDGTSYATVSLSTKIGQAIGVSVAVAVMGACGYVPNAQQSTGALTGINFATNLMMAGLYLLCLIPLVLYPLSEKKNVEILDRLTKKREAIDFEKVGFDRLEEDKFEYGDGKDLVAGTNKYDNLFAVANGQQIKLEEVADEALAKGVLGTGYAIIPNDRQIFAPVNGKVINIFAAKHAIGIQTENGLELLIHMGINTYDMKGEPFEILVSLGENVQAGQLIAKVDLDKLIASGKDTDILVLITNKKQISKFILGAPEEVQGGQPLGVVLEK